MTKQMTNGEQNEELLMDKTECQNQDTTPTLIPLEANLPTEVPTPMNDDQDSSSEPEHEGRDKSPSTSGDVLQDAAPDSTSHQEESKLSDRHTTNLTLHNIALGIFSCMTLMMLLHILAPTMACQGVNLAERALDGANLFSFLK